MIKKRLKEFLIIMLAVITCLSSMTTTVLADGNSVIGDNGGGGAQGMNSSSDWKAWSNRQQFYRFYIINEDMIRVSDIYDYVYTNVATSSENIGTVLKSSRFDGAISPNGYHINSISDLANIMEADISEIPKAVYNGAGHGQQLRMFLLKNIPFQLGGGIPIIQVGGNQGSHSSNSNTTSSTGITNTARDVQRDNLINLGNSLTLLNLTDAYKKLTDEEKENITAYIGNATTFYKVAYNQIIVLDNDLSESDKEAYALGFTYNQINKNNISYNLKAYLISYVNKYKNTIKQSVVSVSRVNMNLLDMNIPLSGEEVANDAKSEKGCPLLLFLENTMSIKVEGYQTAMEALMDNHYLVIEPGTWLYIQKADGSYETKRTYGTFSNIAERWVAMGGRDTGGFYNSILTMLLNNSLTVNSDVVSETGKTILGANVAKRNISQSLAEINSGYGISMHVYSSQNLLEEVIIPEEIDLAGDWTLTESEISKPVTTASRTSLVPMSYMLHTLENCNTSHLVCQHNCGGTCARRSCSRDHEHSSSCRSRYCGHSHGSSCYKYCDSYSLEDRALTFTLRNEKENDYPLLLHALSGTKNNEVQGNRTTTKDETLSPSGFTYDFVVYRGNDKLNYAKYKNNINNLGFLPVDSKTNVTRKTEDYIEHLQISLVDNSADLETSAKGNLHSSLFIDNAESETSINYGGTVVINVYSGKTRLPNLDINENTLMRLTNIRDDSTAGRQIDSKAELRFNPYIRMTYAGLDNIKHDAYVIGEYQRIIYPNDYAEIQWTYEPENMTVRSSMWALDKMYTDGNDDLDWTSPNKVLKGGATYNLVTKKKVVGLNTYQVILGNSSRTISEITGEFNLSESEAISEHEAFVEKALDRFDKTEVIQYVSKNVNDETAWENGIPVYKGADLRELNNGGSTASTEAKYYLETDVNNHENVSRNDLDVKELGTTKKYYRFYSDTSGNIFMVEGNSVTEVEAGTGSQILNKTQSVDSLSGMAQFLNNRTLVITKLLDALERNTGNDTTASWASDGKWYNEAYNGVIIIVQRTGVELEFRLTNERMCVLDPKLVPYIESKLSQVKSENKVAHMSQYCTNLSSGEPISLFKGQGVYMYRANELFNSNKFYIPCMTVQN